MRGNLTQRRLVDFPDAVRPRSPMAETEDLKSVAVKAPPKSPEL